MTIQQIYDELLKVNKERKRLEDELMKERDYFDEKCISPRTYCKYCSKYEKCSLFASLHLVTMDKRANDQKGDNITHNSKAMDILLDFIKDNLK